MLKRSTVIALLAIILVAGLSTAQESANGPISSLLNADELLRAKKGEIIQRGGTSSDGESGSGYVIGYINAPAEKAWATVIDTEKQPEYMPKLISAKLATVTGNTRYADFLLDMGITNVKFSTIQTLNVEKKRLSWVFDKNKPADYITKTDGFWQFEQMADGGTLVQYSVVIEIDLPIVGGLFKGLIKSLAQDDLPKVVEAVRKRVESNNTWRRSN